MLNNDIKPFFSVVIPLYNKQSHIKETIESVLNQTFQDFEIVVVNDGSKDDSAKIVESIQDNRIRLIHQENAGVSVARNRGIKEAISDYVAFLDADDLWKIDYLETIYDLIQKHPNAGLYATAYEMQSKNKTRKLKIKGFEFNEGIIPNYFESIVKGDYIVWTSVVCVPKKVFFDSNIWFPVGETRGEDQYVWARIALEYDMAYNTRVCSIYNLYTENSTSGSVSNYIEPRNFLLDLKTHKSTKNNVELNFWLDKYLEREIFNSIKSNIYKRNKKLALNQIFYYRMPLLIKIKLFFLLPISNKTLKSMKNIYNNFRVK